MVAKHISRIAAISAVGKWGGPWSLLSWLVPDNRGRLPLLSRNKTGPCRRRCEARHHRRTIPPNRASPPSVSPKIPTPHFHQISLPSALSPKAKMILWNVKGWVTNGHAQYSATRNGMKRRAADGKLLSARVIHENRIRPPLNRTSRQFHLCATWPRTQANRYLNLGGLPVRRPQFGMKSHVHKKYLQKDWFSQIFFLSLPYVRYSLSEF